MKLCFVTTLFLLNGLACADLRGSVDDDAMELKRDAANMAGAAALFQNGLKPAQIRRVKDLKASLLPMFESLPKNQHGKLVPQVARYALHRLFEQQHSWSVDGLHSAGNTKQDNIFGQLTADLTEVGISMNNLALLAMVVEHRIHQETLAQVTSTYVALNRSTSTAELSSMDLDVLIERYMTIYISGMRDYDLNSAELKEQRDFMATSTTDWDATTQWVHDAQQDAMRKQKPCGHGITDCSFDFQATTYVVEEVLKGYGGFNHGECKRLKSTLLEMEDRKTGRVSLADFYNKGISGTWQFNEKADYLRDLGTLDESVPGQPRVIVANYVSSWVNCLTSSSLYSVCCRNECEGLMGHLEHNIKSAMAAPPRILQLVRDFRSDDLVVSDISQLQKDRLNQIALKHGGKVPMHGRLFAQWLHHAFPQSCPFPHAAGTANPMTPDEWMKEKGHLAIKATEEEILQVVGVHGNGAIRKETHENSDEHDASGERSMHWSDDEEVFVIHSQEALVQKTPLWRSNGLVMVVQVLAMTSILYGLKKYAKVFRPDKTSFEKHVI